MGRSHKEESWGGVVGRSHLGGVMGESWGSWGGVIVRKPLGGVMGRSHGGASSGGVMGRNHGEASWEVTWSHREEL